MVPGRLPIIPLQSSNVRPESALARLDRARLSNMKFGRPIGRNHPRRHRLNRVAGAGRHHGDLQAAHIARLLGSHAAKTRDRRVETMLGIVVERAHREDEG